MANPHQLQPGEICRVHSLQSATAQPLNLQEITVLHYLPDTERYRCKFHTQGLKNIKLANLDELTPRLAYYTQILQQTNQTEAFIQQVVTQATEWAAQGVRFHLPEGMGIQYTMKYQTPGVDANWAPPHLIGKGSIREHDLCPVNNVIYTLNLRRKWSRFPNHCPVGNIPDQKLHVDLSTHNSLIHNLETILQGDGTPTSITPEYLACCQKLNEAIANARYKDRMDRETGLGTQSKCLNCSQTEKKLKLCTGCKSVFFCSVACQKQSWPTHKIECKKLCQKKGKASGGTSKARALQLIKDLTALPKYPGPFNDVASFGREYKQWFQRSNRALVLSGLHEICEHKERKTLKHALKHNVLDVFRDVVVQQATDTMRQAKTLGNAGVLCLVNQNCINLVDILLEVPETFLKPGEPPVADIKKMGLFLGEGNGCVGFWNLLEMAEMFYRIPHSPVEVQARFIVRSFSKVYAVEALARKILPTLTKEYCKRLVWLSTSFDTNPFDRSGAMQYLAMSIVACLLIQSKKYPKLLPPGYNRNKWLYVPLVRKEHIFNRMVMPAFEYAVKKNRIITTEEMNGFMKTFAGRGSR